ncbi:hypothetical protein DM867_01780 [Halosegnis rubeus]|jgi:hypothetical protein|uniref:DUF7115 domain-containing protein n=1 Tax=Halosegnis rubeus TaxID=2212850 RepID=A0A5N5UNI0_9EURY|nr:hypothetical protein [Halosegnis rubeus]KAB7515896.1 hypothetical protein DM867_01780 [Halosegnis rubeus]KAB7516889.1 hypothetical protein DMP03_05865 [Halosegnis rubeus]KAB7519982.1 hypothetical protein DP108_01665 [Halosegnis rubeus]
MDVPSLVTDRLDGDSVRTRVDLGGDDAVFVTAGQTLVYRAEGLLSDESVSAYPHDVERLDVTTGRKSTFELTYVDTAGKFAVPSDRTDAVLAPLLEGVLATVGVVDSGESVRATYRFSELTLVVTDARLLKHVGSAVWDSDFESYGFDTVTDLETEAGNVASQLVLTADGRPQRVKVPSEEADAVAHTVESALLAFHGVDSVADLSAGEPEPESEPETFEDQNLDTLVSDTEATIDRVASGDTESLDVSKANALTERLASLEETVERQTELLEQQQETIETLVEELRRGR